MVSGGLAGQTAAAGEGGLMVLMIREYLKEVG